MPKSKRDKKVSLTKVQKKGTAKRAEFIEQIRSALQKYDRLFLLSIDNARNSRLKDLRNEMKTSKFIFGKNKLLSVALGRNISEEYQPGLHRVSKLLRGQRCLLATQQSKKEVRDIFNTYRDQDFARSGNTAEQTVDLVAGPMPRFAHTMEPQLKKLGLSVRLVRGIVTLEKDHKVCQKGSVLTPEQCRILKLFGVQMSEFRVNLLAVWEKESGDFKEIGEEDSSRVITSLPNHVRIVCQKLDDGQHYFVPEVVEGSNGGIEDVVMESDEEND